jgi:uncharacterized protein (DUF1684 family)
MRFWRSKVMYSERVRYIFGLCLLACACSSGPPPPDTRPYELQIAEARKAKDDAFKTGSDPLTPEKRATFQGLAYYPVTATYKVPASLTLENVNPPVYVELQNTANERERYRKVGTLGFTVEGQSYRLTAYALENGSLTRLFVPFGDLTNGTETYGGGRFLELDQTPTGLYDLDFNRAFNPFCVFNTTWICPLPPRENHLAVAIRAGEKLPPDYKAGS